MPLKSLDPVRKYASATERLLLADFSNEVESQDVEFKSNLPERVPSQSGTSAFELQIDEMVYKLYDLTEQEIKIVEVKG